MSSENASESVEPGESHTANGVSEHVSTRFNSLVEVARSHGVECWWVTTLLLKRTKEGELTADEATDVLYDLVDEGMNLHPKVYAQVQKKLQELGE
ncbi:hypothetical protein [Salinigranum salinum]|uniref:hypothetical protein n=1 Tax=Salinigranum salinum TaxID=1364937 RepID=UPI00195DA937|nr:hypothetical protein [Salinigranum salinum]